VEHVKFLDNLLRQKGLRKSRKAEA